MHDNLFQITLIFALGAFCQWSAWRLRLPAILLLLITGIVAGPLLNVLNPKFVFGDLLLPLTSLAVAVILYEGGLDLHFNELRGRRRVIFSLISVGCLFNWMLISLAAIYILGFHTKLAFLLGAILTVSGPTVILPLLKHIRPREPVNSILKWEGILIDPVGAILAILVLEEVLIGEQASSLSLVLLTLLGTLAVGYIVGYIFAKLFVLLTKYSALPKELYNTLSLAFLFSAFYVANVLFHEAGLVAVTIMGIVVGNDSHPAVKHVISFKENLRVLLISSLFIVLAASLDFAVIRKIGFLELVFVSFIIIVARPLVVFVSTIACDINIKDKIFMSLMFPRGIVAAAVSSFFAIKLRDANIPGGDELVALVFFVIVFTVVFYALIGDILSRALSLRIAEVQRCLVVGINRFSLEFCKFLKKEDIHLDLVDVNKYKVLQAKALGYEAVELNLLNTEQLDTLDLDSIKRAYIFTSNSDINTLIALRLKNIFGAQAISLFRPEKDSAFNEDLKSSFISDVEFNIDKYRGEEMLSLKIETEEQLQEFNPRELNITGLAIIREAKLLAGRHLLKNKLALNDTVVYIESTSEELVQ